MSNHVVSWAWKQDVPDPECKLILVKLADQANDDGTCWPSRETIARECSMSVSTVKRRIDVLKQLGLVRVGAQRKKKGTNTYGSNVYELAVPRSNGEPRPWLNSDPPPWLTGEPLTLRENPHKNLLATPAAPRKRKPDEIWDTLEAILGPVTNASTRGKRNKAVQLLRESNATPEEIRRRAAHYRSKYPGAALTDTALAGQWDNLAAGSHHSPLQAQQERERAEREADEAAALSRAENVARMRALLNAMLRPMPPSQSTQPADEGGIT